MIGWNKDHAQVTPKDIWVGQHAHLGDTAFLEAEHDRLNDVKVVKEPKAVSTKRKAEK